MKSADAKICASMGNCTAGECARSLEGLKMAEIRLDTVSGLTQQAVKKIFSQPAKTIATCRPGKLGEKERRELLSAAIEAGAAYVDIEVDAPDAYKQEIVGKARAKGCKVIISFHDYQKTPVREELEQAARWCFESGADIAKIACKANSKRDCARLLGLLDSEKPLIAIGMGEKGKITRLAGLLLGSPFALASLAEGRETAEGQVEMGKLEKLMKAVEDA